MSEHAHKVRIKKNGKLTIDGMDVKGLLDAEIRLPANKAPLVILRFIPAELDVEVDSQVQILRKGPTNAEQKKITEKKRAAKEAAKKAEAASSADRNRKGSEQAGAPEKEQGE